MARIAAILLACLLLTGCTLGSPGPTLPGYMDIVPIYPYMTPVPQTTLYKDQDIFVTTVEPLDSYITARYDWPLLKEETIFAQADAIIEGVVLSRSEICVLSLREPDSPGQYKTYLSLQVTGIFSQKSNELELGDIIRILSPVHSRLWDEFAVDPQKDTGYIMILDKLSALDDMADKPQAYADYQILNPVEDIMERYQDGYLVNYAFPTLIENGQRMSARLGLTGMEPYSFYESNYPLSPSTHPSPSMFYYKMLSIFYVEGETLRDGVKRLANRY